MVREAREVGHLVLDALELHGYQLAGVVDGHADGAAGVENEQAQGGGVGRVGAGEEVEGSLEYTDAALDMDGSSYDHWVYRGARAGERIVVTLTSLAFDPFLFVGRVENGGFREMWSNNDAADPPDGVRMSRVVAVLREPGDYVIRVNTFGPDESGAYRLKVERAP